MRTRWTWTVVALGMMVACGVASADRVTVTGQVVGPDGAPAPDAKVLVVYVSPAVKRDYTIGRPVCGADGRFSQDVDLLRPEYPVVVIATRPGSALGWAEATAAGGWRAAVALGADAVTSRGSVTDLEGRPIADAEVKTLSFMATTVEGRRPRQVPLPQADFPPTKTDENGAFALSGFPRDVQLQLSVLAEGRERGYRFVPAGAGEAEARFVLDREAVISGRVTLRGEGVAGVELLCRGQERQDDKGGVATTGEDGRYRVKSLSAATYTLHVREPYDGTATSVARPVTNLALKAGEIRAGVDLELTPGAVVKGTVTDAGDGKGVGDISLEAWAMEYPYFTPGSTWTALTDGTGAYSVRVLPGKIRIRCPWNDRPVEPKEQVLELTEGQMLELVDFAVQPPPALSGQVFLPDGRPAPFAEVSVPTGTSPGPGHDPAFTTTQTDVEGKFRLPVGEGRGYVPEPPWVVVARDVTNDLAAAATVEAAAIPAMLKMVAGAYVVTQAVDERGGPLPGIGVLAYAHDDRHANLALVAYAESDAQGNIRLGPLPADFPLSTTGAYEDRQKLLDREWVYLRKLTLAPGEGRSLPPVRLNPQGRTANGRVLDEAQQPVKGALVYGSGTEAPATTDETGHFALTGLAARGKVWLLTLHPTKPLAAAAVLDPDADPPPDLTLKPFAAAKGRLVDGQGKPLRAEVYLGPWGAKGSPEFSTPRALEVRLKARGGAWTCSSGDDGMWAMDTLLPGVSYEGYAQFADGQMARVSFETKSGETVDLGDMVPKPPE
jgi:protocatechuate 3,4-dioxygenase beta subunit